ncbi:RNA polymerase II holoenzyme cyclin-like subunit [Eutypa lata]|uniref:RNA polymerase II holoenzyme cyclin-like subunit n=1 Tax=Eutypa lata (strain UCR-EL1) TaxID=1287681 RepID=M7THS6_EUTLA|nr:putative rna polymerase ii holoenzyme cyclin-like subunit protein [Eutypa lata UCREL1]KAI1245557.1 RNA polymerase II holoenzyme cyclin-like subunit [Eutypa lata]
MAANYWESTQRRFWQFSKEELAQMREKLQNEEYNLIQMFTLPQSRHLNIYINQQINRLAKRINCKQQPTATAQLYIKRFYCKVEIRRTNPYLVMATALYLACKMEECPQHIRLVVQEARSLWQGDLLALDVGRLGECEFFLISEMNSHLIVHQPYRTLTSLQSDLYLSQDEINIATSVINDHYMTDLPLLYPPHIIALTAILLSLVLRPNSVGGGAAANMAAATAALAQAQARTGAISGSVMGNGQTTPGGTEIKDKQQEARVGKVQRFAAFLAESNVDIEGMVDCTQELISFYECYEQYNDKMTREQINRFIKARGLDKPQ